MIIQISKDNTVNDDDDDNWAVDVSEEAVRARLLDLTDGAKNMTLNDDLEKTEKQRMDLFYEFVKAKRDSQSFESSAAQKEMLSEAERLAYDPVLTHYYHVLYHYEFSWLMFQVGNQIEGAFSAG